VEDDIPEVSSAVPPEAPAEDTVADDIPEVSSAVPPAPRGGEAPQGMAQTDAAAAPAAAAAAAEEGTAADVEESVVTEETARSSAEDFGTAIERQDADADASDDSDDRRETLQRALAAGLAGAALAALLDQGGQVTADSGDRLVLQQDDGNLRLFRDENALLRQPGARVRTETFDDGSTRTRVLRDDGSEVVTIRAADGTLLRRTRVLPDGREVLLIDDMETAQPVEVAELPEPAREVVRYTGDEEELRAALARAMSQDVGRSFSLRQIRELDRVRYLAPEIEIDAITFPTGSAAIQPDQAQQLAVLGRALVGLVEENPAEVFLIEGHTDAVGDASYNLALSDRRAESVALALTEYFDVPPENLVVQGYGEFDLKVPTSTAERENRRANVRRITGLLGVEEAGLR
jgi:outer membrane protein OmpA-like peptidoglycan-associated protein